MHYNILALCTVTVALILAHAVISRRKPPPEQPGDRRGHWSYRISLLISVLLLLIYVSCVVGIYYTDITRPHVGSKPGMLLFLLVPGILFQLFFLVSSLRRQQLPHRRIPTRLVAILLGLFLAAQLQQAIADRAMQDFEKRCQPLVAKIAKTMPQPCNGLAGSTDLLAHKDENDRWSPGDPWQLWHDKDFFVLSFPGGSADIDGSTVYYCSKDKSWTIFHNDSKEQAEKLQALLKGMRNCRQQAGP